MVPVFHLPLESAFCPFFPSLLKCLRTVKLNKRQSNLVALFLLILESGVIHSEHGGFEFIGSQDLSMCCFVQIISVQRCQLLSTFHTHVAIIIFTVVI